ncbi:MAG: peptidylprolyl isomerase [Candidatus Pacearchaeota archaeon]
MDKKAISLVVIIILVVGGFLIYKMNSNGLLGRTVETSETKVKLETNYGEIVIELYDEMPITTANFVSLVKKGTYNGVIFHRIIDGFMIQGGDPIGTGYGDDSIPKIKDEFTNTILDKNNRGTISMANAGPNTGSSQFFINLADNNYLDGKHPVFGKVIDGMDVVDKIAKVDTDSNDRPLIPVKIIRASVI